MDLFSSFIQSLGNPAAYAIFRRHSLGRAFLYLVFVTVLFSAISHLPFIFNFNGTYGQGLAWFAAKAPEFSFQNGILEVQGKMPIIIDKTPGALYLVDTSGQTGPAALKDYREGALITKDKIIYKKSAFETREYDLGAYRAFSFNKHQAIGFLAAARPYFYVGLLLAIVLSSLAGRLLIALFISLLGLLLYPAMNVKASFGDLYKLTIYAMTAPALLLALLEIFRFQPSFLFSLLTLVYLYLAGKQLPAEG
jgi:hypothetical protein